METLLSQITSRDIKERLQGAVELEDVVQSGQIDLGEADVLLKAIPALLKDNNAKVCQSGVSTLGHLITFLGEDFKPYISTFAPLIVERMADTKPATRERMTEVVLALSNVVGPTTTLDKIQACWKHKNYRAREQILNTWVALREHFGATAIPPGSYLDEIIKLLSDQKVSVREAAMKCLDDVYEEWGQKLVHILTNKGIRSAQLGQIKKRFAELGGEQGHDDDNDTQQNEPVPLSERQRTASSGSIAGAKKERITLTPIGDEEAPIYVTSGKELQSKLNRIASTLSSASNPWDQRLEALHSLSALVRGNAVEYDEMNSSLRSLIDPLITSVSDLRSQISRAGCEAVSAMAKALGSDFDRVAEALMPALLKLPFVSVQVIALSGASCIRQVLTYCESTRLIPHFLKALKGRNTDLRVHCIGYLNLVLSQWSKQSLDKHAAAIQDILKDALKDASNEVRKTARIAFWSYSRYYETRALRIHASLDPQAQKVLEASQHDADAHTPVDENLVHDFGMSSSRPVTSSQRGSRNSRERKKKPGPAPDQIAAAAALPPAAPSQAFEQHAPTARAGPSLNQYSNNSSSSNPYDEIPVGRHQGSGGGHMGYADIHSQRQVRPPITVDTDPYGDFDEDTNPDAYADYEPPRKPARAAPRAGSATSSSRREHVSGIANRPPSASSKRSGSRSAHRRPSTEVAATPAPVSLGHAHQNANVVDFAGEDLPTIFLKADSEIWSTRIEAFVQIKSVVETAPSKVVHPHFKKLISVFDEHLPDPHYKVTMQAFDTLCAVMVTYRTSLETYLERLVPKILLKLSDAKQMVRASAGKALEALGECYETDILFPLLLRILEHRNPKVKQSALEFVLGLARVDPAYFETGSHMRGYLMRLAGFSGDKNGNLRKVAVHILLDLFQGHQAVFVSQFVQLPTGLQHELQGRLKSQIPDLQHIIRAAKEEHRYGGSAAPTRGRDPPSQYRDYDPYQSAAVTSAQRSSPGYEQEDMYDDDFEEDVSDEYSPPRPPQQPRGGPTSARRAPEDQWAMPVQQVRHPPQQQPHEQHQHQREMPGLKPKAPRPTGHHSNEYDGPSAQPVSSQRRQPPVDPAIIQAARGQPQQAARDVPSYNPRAYQEKELLVSNPQDPAQVVPQLLSQVSLSDDPATRAEAIHRLIKLSRNAKPAVWAQFFGRILLVVLEGANDRDSGVRELAVLLIKEMLRNQSHSFAEFLEVVMSRLLECYRDPAREVTQAGEDALAQLIKSQPVQRCLEVLVPTIISEDGPVLLGGLKALSKIVKAMPPHDLLSQLPAILPGVFEAFKNPNADIRKAVVFCLVDMYLVLGDKFTPFLGELNTSQLKLVTIYINRLVKTR